MKELILVTGGFPYGNGETFLETEIKYLAEEFDKVNIVAVNPVNNINRTLPENCETSIVQINIGRKEKFKALSYLFTSLFWNELKVIRLVYKKKLSIGIINTMLISLYRASKIRGHIERMLNNNDQILYSYWCDDAALGLALTIKTNNKLKAICRIHRWDVYFEESQVDYLPYRRFITGQLTNVYSISKDGINYAVKNWKVESQNFRLSRLGVETQKAMVQKDIKSFTLFSCSNLIPVKRVHIIAEAVKALDGKFALRWVHIGDGSERLKIEEILKDVSELTEVYLVGRLTNKKVFDLYRQFNPDLFINVSSSEGVPVSIMEAMSFGVPAIATNVGGNREIVNNQNGRLVSQTIDSDELASVISEFNSSSELESYRLAAWNTWDEKYKAKKNYEEFIKEIKN